MSQIASASYADVPVRSFHSFNNLEMFVFHSDSQESSSRTFKGACSPCPTAASWRSVPASESTNFVARLASHLNSLEAALAAADLFLGPARKSMNRAGGTRSVFVQGAFVELSCLWEKRLAQCRGKMPVASLALGRALCPVGPRNGLSAFSSSHIGSDGRR